MNLQTNQDVKIFHFYHTIFLHAVTSLLWHHLYKQILPVQYYRRHLSDKTELTKIFFVLKNMRFQFIIKINRKKV